MKVLLPLLLPLMLVQSWGVMFQPQDCADVGSMGSDASGVYRIYPAGPTSVRYVYCDMDTDGGKWTVFQRRMDGTVNFFRGWEQYKDGFGNAAGEYWLGLEIIYLLTLKKDYELRVDMEDFNGAKAYASYSSFSLSTDATNPQLDGYRLNVSGFTDGGAGDSLLYHSGQKFSTFDKDQDNNNDINCALDFEGAHWYDSCYLSNPNGVYAWGMDTQTGASWRSWKGFHSLKSISMKIRPVSPCSGLDIRTTTAAPS